MMDDNFFYAHSRKNTIHSAVHVDKEQKKKKDSKFTANYYTQSL